MMNDPRRLFTARQARLKAIACGGLCEGCERDLPEGFHMHHIIPHSEGGRTILSNCLALCPECHRKKHDGRTERMAADMQRRIR